MPAIVIVLSPRTDEILEFEWSSEPSSAPARQRLESQYLGNDSERTEVKEAPRLQQ